MNEDKTFIIDNITWNDLNMDAVFERMNTASSSVGTEFLKTTLKTLVFDEQILQSRDVKISALSNDEKSSANIKKIYKNLGKTKKVSFLDYIFKLNEIKPHGNGKHIILIILLLLAIALIFIKPAVGIIALVVMIAVNIILYFKFKAPIEPYFNCIKYLVSMINAADKLSKALPHGEVFDSDISKLRQLVKIFGPIRRGSFLITNSVAGSIVDVIMDYVRMLFHVDLIKFNSMHKLCSNHNEDISALYDILGQSEAFICIGEYRKNLNYYCTPDFSNEEVCGVDIVDMVHPLVRKPVPNSIKENCSILLTGSNASGKSTFLKMVAINQIFAQTIYTCYARSFRTRFYKVISSMALNDNILGEESYFIVEIKSLKRIFNALSEDVPVMAFVDEVLRGTNTKERIAASSEILKKLSHENALCFAATHDIELTDILKSDMANYHFSEVVSDETNDVLFDYKLQKGRATSHNAIKLLKAYSFPEDVVNNALKMAEEFN